MNEKSFIGALFSFIFAFAGFISHGIAIFTGTDLAIVILAFVYVTPLLIDAIEDFSSLAACNFAQYCLDEASIVTGSLYLMIVLLLFALQTGINTFQIQGVWAWIVKIVLVVPTAIFIVRTFYVVRIKWTQNRNVAKAYYPQEEHPISK